MTTTGPRAEHADWHERHRDQYPVCEITQQDRWPSGCAAPAGHVIFACSTGVAWAEPVVDVLGILLGTDDDYEHETIMRVAVRAGLLWQCQAPRTDLPAEPCGWNNRAEYETCSACGAHRNQEGIQS